MPHFPRMPRVRQSRAANGQGPGRSERLRNGLIASVVLHLALLLAVAVPYQRQSAHGETIAVELVPETEAPAQTPAAEPAPPEPEAQPPRPEPQPDFSALQRQEPTLHPDPPAQAAAQQQQQEQQERQQQQQQQAARPPQAGTPPPQARPPAVAQAEAPAQPQAEPEGAAEPAQPPQDQAGPENWLLAMRDVPVGPTAEYGSEADRKADVDVAALAAFKAQLKKCWVLPPGVSSRQQVKVVVRAAFQRDGSLASEPVLIEASASPLGPPLMRAGFRALKQCGPYTMLPADRYDQWRVLDINFSPDQMAAN